MGYSLVSPGILSLVTVLPRRLVVVPPILVLIRARVSPVHVQVRPLLLAHGFPAGGVPVPISGTVGESWRLEPAGIWV